MIIICTLILCLYIGCFFQIRLFRYVDEIIGLWAIIFITYKCCNNNPRDFDSMTMATIGFLSMMMFIGVLSNLLYHYQNSWKSVIYDAFTFIKPFITFEAIYLLCSKVHTGESLKKFILIFSKIATVIIFGCLIISSVFNIPEVAFYDSWATFKSIKTFVFMTQYPGQLAVLISSLVMILLAEYKKCHLKYILANIISIFCTQSGVGFISIFLLIIFGVTKKNKKLRWYHIFALTVGGIIVGYNEIYYYLLTSTAARSVLLKYGFVVAQRFFPLGAGFANYGSAVAASDYSRLYYEYNFGAYWGMGNGSEVDFLHDSYYPIIIGEFGFIGLITYVVYLYKQFSFINSIKNNWKLRYALLFAFVLILVMNIGQGSFSGNVGSIYMILFGIYFNEAKIRRRV